MTNEAFESFLDAFAADHRALARMIGRAKASLRQGEAAHWSAEACANTAAEIAEVQRHITTHFAQEEQGGYLDEALSRAPRFAPRAAELLKEHAELLHQAQELTEAFQRAAIRGAIPCGETAERAKKFLESLVAHEVAENRLVEQAFNVALDVAS